MTDRVSVPLTLFSDLEKIRLLDADIAETLRQLAALRKRRDTISRRNGRHPVGPKGPIPKGSRRIKKRKLQPTERSILEFLSKQWMKECATHRIAEGTGMNDQTCAHCITRLVRDGYMTRIRRGFYKTGRKVP